MNTHWLSVHGMRTNGQIDLIGLHNVRKSGATDALNIGADIEQIKMYISKIKPDIIIADIGDSGDKVAKLIEYYGEGKVFGSEYSSSPYATNQLIPVWNESRHTVRVDKLTQNKRYIAMLKEGMILHPGIGREQNLDMYLNHWMNVTIRDEEDDRTGDFKQVIGRRGDDHYAQASVYSMIGIERLRELYYGDGQYGFNSNFIDLQYGTEPTPPDIYSGR